MTEVSRAQQIREQSRTKETGGVKRKGKKKERKGEERK